MNRANSGAIPRAGTADKSGDTERKREQMEVNEPEEAHISFVCGVRVRVKVRVRVEGK